ncbi:hypothetical protein AB0D12_05890 [Streptomyces sp. NPDC048479]
MQQVLASVVRTVNAVAVRGYAALEIFQRAFEDGADDAISDLTV